MLRDSVDRFLVLFLWVYFSSGGSLAVIPFYNCHTIFTMVSYTSMLNLINTSLLSEY